ncbi:uncharacterized protein PRAS40 [Anabrus simplex]|uniref:uncharacterized protein PRAS40 n=1 Tax=Anabrus simplex TaxID=316456 RepID=UPI0035A3B708
MLITCKCLNVAIDTQGSDAQEVEISSLGLTAAEQNDLFFKEMLHAVEHGRISKVQSSLVQIRNIGNWIIHCCLNCSMNTHAIHRDKGAAVVLCSKALLSNADEIAALKSSDKYSPVFRIVISHSELEKSALPPTKFSVSQLPSPVQTALSALQQQLTEGVQREAARTEERVRQYTEQQYAALEEFREQAHQDHRLLARLLYEAQEKLANSLDVNPSSLNSLDTPPSTPDNHNIPASPLPNPLRSLPRIPVPNIQNNPSSPGAPLNTLTSNNKQFQVAGKHPSPLADLRVANRPNPISPNVSTGNPRAERRLPMRLFSHPGTRGSSKGGSFDSEGLFDLEGMDEIPSDMLHSEEETDTDDSGSHDEGIHIPRSRGLHDNLAKSLPVNVPAYQPPEHRVGKEREDDTLPQDPMDIAASIKALAKSVHGDANVFGDLPRPRFSTQI